MEGAQPSRQPFPTVEHYEQVLALGDVMGVLKADPPRNGLGIVVKAVARRHMRFLVWRHHPFFAKRSDRPLETDVPRRKAVDCPGRSDPCQACFLDLGRQFGR
jgi:hypothetical protein